MNTKTTLILAVAALAVCTYVFFVKPPWQAPDDEKTEAEAVAKKLFEDLKADDVTAVTLERLGQKFAFAKDDKQWKLVEPIQAPADENRVKSDILQKVADLKYVKSYPAGDKGRPSAKVTGLDEPRAVVSIKKGDTVVGEVKIGRSLPAGKGSYLQLASSDTVYVSENDLSEEFRSKLADYRDKTVLKFDAKNVTRVTAEGMRNFELVKADDDKWVIESPARGRADKARADRVVRPLSNLYVQDFKADDPPSLAPYRLHEPRFKLTVETETEVPPKAKPGDPDTQPADTQPSTEKKTYTLLVGGPVDTEGKSFFAKLADQPWVFALAEYNFKDLTPDLAELRDKDLADVTASAVTRIHSTTPGGAEATLTKDDKSGQWKLEDGATADAAAVDELIKAVSDLKATHFAEPDDMLAQPDWSKPRAAVEITIKGKLDPVRVLVGPETGSGKMVYVRNAAEEAVAAVRREEVEPLLLPPVAYRDRAILSFPRDRATFLEIARADGDGLTLVKENNLWKMATPIEAPADADHVRNLLADLSSLRAERVAGVGNPEQFGLDKPQVRLAVHVTPPAAQPDAKVIPATQPAGEDAPPADEPAGEDAQPSDEPATQPAASATDTRPAHAADTPPAGRKGMTVEELLEYQKSLPKEGEEVPPGKEGLPKQNPLATKMLEEMVAKKQAGEGAQTQPAVGDQPAVAEAEPTNEAEAETPQPKPVPEVKPTVFRIALTKRDDGTVYAAVEGRDTIYVLDAKVYDDAIAEMHEAQLTKFEVADVVELAFGSGGDELHLRKSGETWMYVRDPVLPIDDQKVKDVINVFRDLKTHRYVAYKADDLGKYQLGDPAGRVSIALKDGRKVEILLSADGPKDDADKSRYAVKAGTNKVFLLKGEQADKFAQKLEDFEKKSAPS